MCIYIYIYNIHLGLINGPPLMLFLPNNYLFHYPFTIKQNRDILNVWPICINPCCDTGDYPPSWGDPVARL